MQVDDKLAKEKLAREFEKTFCMVGGHRLFMDDIRQLIRNTDLTDCTGSLVCCQKFDTCNERCWPLICHLREQLRYGRRTACKDQGASNGCEGVGVMDLRFIEREETELVYGTTYRITRVRILQFRDGPSSPWIDVPLVLDTGSE